MNIADYQKAALRTAPKGVSDEEHALHAVLGLTSEAGEIATTVKRWYAYNKPLDKQNIVEELGDILWFVSLMSHAIGVPMEKLAELNIRKLELRFPSKTFNEADATINRDTSKEAEVFKGVAT